MKRISLLVIGLLLISAPAFGQKAATDSQTLQDLLQEVRQLRHDLQASITISQRAQIVLYRMQTQQIIVARMQQRVDDARARLSEAQAVRKKMEAEMKINEEMKDRTQNAIERKEYEDVLPRLKARLEELGAEEQQAQNREIEAEGQLQTEQAKLDGLQSELDRLGRTLENLAQQPGNVKQ